MTAGNGDGNDLDFTTPVAINVRYGASAMSISPCGRDIVLAS